jgi:hypothetical protein
VALCVPGVIDAGSTARGRTVTPREMGSCSSRHQRVIDVASTM